MQTGTPALDLSHIRFTGRAAAAGRPTPRPRTILPPSLTDDVLPASGLPAAVLMAAGIAPTGYRAAALDRRTAACLRALRADGVDSARRRLADEPALLDAALSAFLIGVSGFFRDTAVFETLATKVLPTLADRDRRLRVCSVGCSTGEELYSIALLLADAGLLERCELVGVDCRPAAIASARSGRYPAASIASLPAWCHRYFARHGNEVEIASDIRQSIAWQVGDATSQVPPGRWHLALCRNVVIYLTPAAGGRLLGEVASRLVAPGGVLVVGKAERPPAGLLTPLAPSVYVRRRA